MGPVFQEGRDPGEALVANDVAIEFVSESAVGRDSRWGTLSKALLKSKIRRSACILRSSVWAVAGELYELGFTRYFASEPMLVMEEDVVVVEVVHDVAYHNVFHYFAGDTGERDGSVVGGRVL